MASISFGSGANESVVCGGAVAGITHHASRIATCDATAVVLISLVREVHGRHATGAEFTDDGVAVRESRPEALHDVVHRFAFAVALGLKSGMPSFFAAVISA